MQPISHKPSQTQKTQKAKRCHQDTTTVQQLRQLARERWLHRRSEALAPLPAIVLAGEATFGNLWPRTNALMTASCTGPYLKQKQQSTKHTHTHTHAHAYTAYTLRQARAPPVDSAQASQPPFPHRTCPTRRGHRGSFSSPTESLTNAVKTKISHSHAPTHTHRQIHTYAHTAHTHTHTITNTLAAHIQTQTQTPTQTQTHTHTETHTHTQRDTHTRIHTHTHTHTHT